MARFSAALGLSLRFAVRTQSRRAALPPHWRLYSTVADTAAVVLPPTIIGAIGIPLMLLRRWIPTMAYGILLGWAAVSIGALVVYHATPIVCGKGDDA